MSEEEAAALGAAADGLNKGLDGNDAKDRTNGGQGKAAGAPNAAEVAATLGEAKAEGAGWRCRCPVCDGHNLTLRDGDTGLLAFCWNGCEPAVVYAALKRLKLNGAGSARPPDPNAAEKLAYRNKMRRQWAAEIYRGSVPAKRNDLVSVYLASRHIWVDEVPSAIRLVPRFRHKDAKLFLPAMLGLVQHVGSDEAIVGVQLTYLNPLDPSVRSTVDPRKQSFGPIKGGAVRLAPAAPTLAVAEGIEDALTFQIKTETPSWAALGTEGMKGLVLPPLDVTQHVILIEDQNDAGREAVNATAVRLTRDGYRVSIARPTSGKDLNEALHLAGGAHEIADFFTVEEYRPVILNDAAEFSEGWLALEFVAAHLNDLRYTAKWNTSHLWNGYRWVEDEKLRAFSLAHELCRRLVSPCGKSKAAMIANQAKTRAGVLSLARENPLLATGTDEWDRDKMQLGTPTGVVDLRTGELNPNDPAALLTKTTATGPGGDCLLWKQTLNEIFQGDKDHINFLQRLAGYFLTGDVSEEILVILYGEGGNGKGTIIETLLYVLGNDAAPLPLSTLLASGLREHATEIAGLRGKRLVAASEPPDGARWNTARIKALTGGNILSRRFMRADYFEFEPTHKLLIEGNTLPRFGRIDDAIRRRLILWHLKATFSEPDLTRKAKLREEAAGILAWMIEGCLKWKREGLNPPKNVRLETTAYLAEADDLDMFVSDCLIVERGARISSGVAFTKWKVWCSDNGVFADTRRSFTDRMIAKGYEGGRGTGNVYHFSGLREAAWNES